MSELDIFDMCDNHNPILFKPNNINKALDELITDLIGDSFNDIYTKFGHSPDHAALEHMKDYSSCFIKVTETDIELHSNTNSEKPIILSSSLHALKHLSRINPQEFDIIIEKFKINLM